jgi:hypothetical protein
MAPPQVTAIAVISRQQIQVLGGAIGRASTVEVALKRHVRASSARQKYLK